MEVIVSKLCKDCGESFPATKEYFSTSNGGKYLGSYCRGCKSKRNRNWTVKQYDISEDEYNQMFEAQNGRCAICGRHQSELTKTLAVDHNHRTGQVRALLCGNCNTGIGNLMDSPELLEMAAQYLRSYE